MAMIELAIKLAVKAHASQKDKAGEPYILHPLWVMSKVASMDEKIVAVLHDAVEDSSLSLAELRSYDFPDHIVDAIDSVSRREGESYKGFLKRVKVDRIGRSVKLADISHHLSRYKSLPDSLKIRYLQAKKFLLSKS